MSKIEEIKPTGSSSKRPFFKNAKTGAQTPVLRKKKDEEEGKFFERMTSIGYVDAKIDGNHWSTDKMALHTGPADKCKSCKKMKPTGTSTVAGEAPAAVQPVVPDAKVKTQAVKDDKLAKEISTIDKASAGVSGDKKKQKDKKEKK